MPRYGARAFCLHYIGAAWLADPGRRYKEHFLNVCSTVFCTAKADKQVTGGKVSESQAVIGTSGVFQAVLCWEYCLSDGFFIRFQYLFLNVGTCFAFRLAHNGSRGEGAGKPYTFDQCPSKHIFLYGCCDSNGTEQTNLNLWR